MYSETSSAQHTCATHPRHINIIIVLLETIHRKHGDLVLAVLLSQ